MSYSHSNPSPQRGSPEFAPATLRPAVLAVAVASALAFAGHASAEPNGWYGAVDAGYHQVADLEVVSNLNGSRNDLDLDGSWAAFARLGYRFDENWRVELEGGYRSEAAFGDVTDVDTGRPGVCNISFAGGCSAPTGDVGVTTFMVNVLHDFAGRDSRIRPFVGLGAGAARVTTQLEGPGLTADDHSTHLAAQGLAGVSVKVSERALLDLTYRYLMTDIEFATTATQPGYPPGDFSGDFDNSHTVTLGLRYAFGADEPAYVSPPAPQPLPPAPQPPAPRPTPPAPVVPADREFVVYFDWDRSDLTAEAQSIVTQAANYAKSGRPTRILIVGHADTSGSAAYNVGLSSRRARTVGDALVAQGISGGVISLDGKGETSLARATADGVREPLNRRATVGINFR